MLMFLLKVPLSEVIENVWALESLSRPSSKKKTGSPFQNTADDSMIFFFLRFMVEIQHSNEMLSLMSGKFSIYGWNSTFERHVESYIMSGKFSKILFNCPIRMLEEVTDDWDVLEIVGITLGWTIELMMAKLNRACRLDNDSVFPAAPDQRYYS